MGRATGSKREDIVDELCSLAIKLIEIPSESTNEAVIAGFVFDYLSNFPHLAVTRLGDNVIARYASSSPERTVIVAGHLDTVPANENAAPALVGERIYGLGSADMKSGIAVMLGLCAVAASFSDNVTFVFYAREEVASSMSGLLEIEREKPQLLHATAAILMEPTSSTVEAGCQGTMRVAIRVKGARAHTARPWTGVNAIHRVGELVQAISTASLARPMIDGVEYREALEVVSVEGGVANNVVPDLVTLVVNYRFAPDKDMDQAFRYVKSIVADSLSISMGDEIEIVEAVTGAMPNLESEIVSKLCSVSGRSPSAKLGWTDVAFFSSRGLPATNFGPGNPLVAHTRNEYVDVEEIKLAYGAMVQLLG